MQRTKIFKSGNSMAVRLPKGFNIEGNEVEILQRDGEIVLREIPQQLDQAFLLLTEMPDDFYRDGRSDNPAQTRDLD